MLGASRAAGPGEVRWDGRVYEAVSPLAFHGQGGRDVIAFGEADGSIRYFFRPGGEYGRVSWFVSRSVQLTLWAFFLVMVLAGIVVWLVARLRDLLRPGPRWP